MRKRKHRTCRSRHKSIAGQRVKRTQTERMSIAFGIKGNVARVCGVNRNVRGGAKYESESRADRDRRVIPLTEQNCASRR